MTIRLWVLLPLGLLWALGSQAQTAAPAKADSQAETKADPKAEATAAMERAKRQAAGPMRVILEASKGRKRAGDAEPAAAPAVSDASNLRPVAARQMPAPEAVSRAASPPQPLQTTALAAPPIAAATPPTAAAAQAPEPNTAPSASGITTQVTLNSEALQTRGVAPVPALERASVATPLQATALPFAALPKVQEGAIKPKLVSRVDPDLPQRLLDDLGRNAVVPVDINIRANGSVAAVGFSGSLPVRAQRLIAAALEQWRFEPLPSDRTHRVELVFNGE